MVLKTAAFRESDALRLLRYASYSMCLLTYTSMTTDGRRFWRKAFRAEDLSLFTCVSLFDSLRRAVLAALPPRRL